MTSAERSVSSQRMPLVIWGGGTGGVAAAIQAARMGVETLLLTPGPWLGGMLSAAGVAAPDGHELSCWQTGLWGAFLRGMAADEPEGLDHNWVSCFGFHPCRAEQLLQRWVGELPLLSWRAEVSLKGIERQGDRLTAIQIEQWGKTEHLQFELLIDGSDLGDTLPFAEAQFRWGWEPRERWHEPSAPPQHRLEGETFFKAQPIQSPTWVVIGQIDAARQLPDQSPPLPAPFTASTAAYGLERTITYGRLPGGLVMLNWPLAGNDWHQGLERQLTTDGSIRAQLAAEMQAHSLDFLNALENASDGWLKAAGIFPGPNPSLALMPYWREGRRLIGLDTVVETDLLPMASGSARGPLPFDDNGRCTSVAVGTYANDHHYPGDDWPLAAKSCRWGGRWTGTPFCIPFSALVSAEISNLLIADKAFSVSHMANGATRLQPLILNIGQAAGMAAALCLQQQQIPSELDSSDLQQALLDDPIAPAAVVPIWDWPAWHPGWRAAQQAVLDHPECLSSAAELELPDLNTRVGAPPLPDQTPLEPRAREFRGLLKIEADESYQLSSGSECWTLITLEPAVRRWLLQCRNGEEVSLLAVCNPWGPWLRVLQVIC